MQKKAKIVTLGCYKNLVDSERVMRQLELHGVTLIPEDQNADYLDIVAINTCGFIHDAKEESINTIFGYVDLKLQGKIGKLIVFGCLSERYRDELTTEIPEVDHFLGKFSITEIVEALNLKIILPKLYQRVITTPSHYAYLKISEGCNRKCAFCAIPLITGKHKSSTVEELVMEAKFLADKGVKEIIFVAQDLNQFGSDLKPKSSLYNLIEKVSEIPEIEWIRLQYLYPKGFPKKLPKLIANNPKICHYIDIPFQHASNKMLQLMDRGHSYEDNMNIINSLRDSVPDIAIRTTLIAGFPGETPKDFDELMRFVETVRFDRLGAFAYSHEENTPAARKYKDTVSKKLKEKRVDLIMSVQERISTEKNEAKIGTIQRVIVDRLEGNNFIGRTQYDSPEVDNEVIIEFYKKNKPKIGQLVDVLITDAQAFDLFGKVEK
jgi:ribosomal protein S12 methylthiotransferase